MGDDEDKEKKEDGKKELEKGDGDNVGVWESKGKKGKL